MTTNWAGISYGDPETGKTNLGEPAFLFSYQEIRYSAKYFEIIYLMQHYQKQMAGHVPGIKIKYPFLVKGKERQVFMDMNYLLGRKNAPYKEGFFWGIGVVL